jgi:hypothetical protein
LAAAYRESIREMRAFTGPIVTSAGTAVRPEKFAKGKKVAGYNSGVVSVPGPKGAGDIIPAMLSPGEAVIPTAMANKYGSLINAMIDDEIPGFMAAKRVAKAPRITLDQAAGPFKQAGTTPMVASHFAQMTPANAPATVVSTVGNLAEVEKAYGIQFKIINEQNQTLVKLTPQLDGTIQAVKLTNQSLKDVAEEIRNAKGDVTLTAAGDFYGGTTILESADLNQAIQNIRIPSEVPGQPDSPLAQGSPLSTGEAIAVGQDAQALLNKYYDEAGQEKAEVPETIRQYKKELQELARLGQEAAKIQQESNSESEANLEFIKMQAKDSLTQGYISTDMSPTDAAAQADEDLAEVTAEIARVREVQAKEGRVNQEELNKIEQDLIKAKLFAVKEAKVLAEEGITTNEVRNLLKGGRSGQGSKAATRELVETVEGAQIPITEGLTQYAGTTRGKAAPRVAGAILQEEINKKLQVAIDTGATQIELDESVATDAIRQRVEAAGIKVVTVTGTSLADGVEVGSKGVDLKQAGASMPEEIAEGLESRKGEVRQKAEELADSVASAIDPNVPRIGPPTQEQFKAQQLEELGEAGFAAKQFGERAGETAGKLSDMSGKLVMSSFALTSLVGAASSVEGPIGDLAQKIMPALTVLTGLSGVLRLVNREMIVNFVQRKAENAKLAFDTAQKAANTTQTGFNTNAKRLEAAASMKVVAAKNVESAASAGLLGRIKGFGAALRSLIGPTMRLFGLFGLLAGGIFALVRAHQNQEARIRSFGEAARFSEEQLRFFANSLGAQRRSTAFQTGILGTSQDPEQIDLVKEIRESDNFKDTFEGVIRTLRGATDDVAGRLLTSQAVKLQAEGFDEKEISAIIEALKIEAGKTDLQIDLGSVVFDGENAEQVVENIVNMARDANERISRFGYVRIWSF